MGGYSSVFGGTAVKPSLPQYEALTIGETTAMVWPLETIEGVPYVAAQIDVTATATGLQLQMPPANEGSTGVACIITNVGTDSFTLTDTSGNAIQTIAATVSYVITLTDNSTLNGTWRSVQLGATVAEATAAQLADNETLYANGAVLQAQIPTNYQTLSTLLSADQRGSLNVWQGTESAPSGVLSLDLAANLGQNWFCFATNESTGTLTLQPAAGELINGAGNLTLQPGVSAIVVCDGTNFNCVGVVLTPIPVSSGGTGSSSANGALVNLGGTTTGITIFTSPTVSAVLSYLGLNIITFTESTVNTNQNLTSGSSQTCFVNTLVAGITLSLPQTTGLTTKFVFCAFAQAGPITVTPNGADSINGQAAGANYVIAQGASVMFTTDANGNWWPFFAATGGTVTSVGLAAPGQFAVTNSPVIGAGTLTVAWVNQEANTVLAGPVSGGGAAPTFRALVAADIPGLSVPRSYLAGLQLSNDETTPNSVLDISEGVAMDSTQTVPIFLNSAFTKTTSALWAAGSGNGGMGNGLGITANTWYHVFAILNGGSADIYFDTSITAANAPAGTTNFRYIGSFKTDASSHILPFTQDGDLFLWGDPIMDQSAQTSPSPAELIVVNVPPGVVVTALFNANLVYSANSNTQSFFYGLNAPMVPGLVVNFDSGEVAGQFAVLTNSSQEISTQASTNGGTTYSVSTYGYINRRGRDN